MNTSFIHTVSLLIRRFLALGAVVLVLSLSFGMFSFAGVQKGKKVEKAEKKEKKVALCSQMTLEDCYGKALVFFRGEDFGEAKKYFEAVIAVDVDYKMAGKYLKRCHAKLAEQSIAKQTLVQQQAREEAKKKEAARLSQGLPGGPGGTRPQATIGGAYRIGVGDVLEISVWRNSDLDKNVIVRPDGVISYPLVGDLAVVGLTLTEIDDRLTKALTDYVRNPVVSLAVQRFGGIKVIVLGQVRGPGIYSPAGGGSVMDLVALAGGFTDDAVRRGTFLIRNGAQGPQVYRLNLARVFKGDLGQNIPVQPNDIIYVPKTFIANVNHLVAQITPLLSNTLLTTSVIRDIQDMLGSSSGPTAP